MSLSSALSWFGLSRENAKAAQERSRFNYSPELIGALKADHAELLEVYSEMEKLAIAGRYASINAVLQGFKAKFDIHILNENLHFYCYIEEKFANRPTDQDLIRSFRGEMNAIARTVVNFIKKYDMAGVRPSNGNEFLAELRQVGAALVSRIEREERDLYALYQP